MSGVILHHYAASPVSEKVRVALGIKGLSWKSVMIPGLPPEPPLVPLAGGFRVSPGVHTGAAAYCDRQCILRELERRYPKPTLFPKGASAQIWGLGRWIDGEVFSTALEVIFAQNQSGMPEGFIQDRFSLYFDEHETVENLQFKLSENLAFLRAQIGWLDDALADKRFMAGDNPGMSDAYVYYLIWFLRERFSDGADLLREFEQLQKWEKRVKDIGHGTVEEISADKALEIALHAEPEPGTGIDAMEPMDFKRDAMVSISSSQNKDDVVGNLIALGRDKITILRTDKHVGRIAIHFPRVGYQIRQFKG